MLIRYVASMPPPSVARNGQLKNWSTVIRDSDTNTSAGSETMNTKRFSTALLLSPNRPLRPARCPASKIANSGSTMLMVALPTGWPSR